jgi:hypothetical protein
VVATVDGRAAPGIVGRARSTVGRHAVRDPDADQGKAVVGDTLQRPGQPTADGARHAADRQRKGNTHHHGQGATRTAARSQVDDLLVRPVRGGERRNGCLHPRDLVGQRWAGGGLQQRRQGVERSVGLGRQA